MFSQGKMLLLAAAIVAIGVGCQSPKKAPSSDTTGDDAISVQTSFYPLFYLASEIGGDAAVVNNITPAGVDAHDFEPTARDIAAINDADVFVYHGQGIDPWAERVAKDAAKSGAEIVETTEFVTLLVSDHDEHEGQEDHDENVDNDDHMHGMYDPHTWLDPVRMTSQAEAVRDAFIAADPENAATYTTNTAELVKALRALDASFDAGLASCQLDTIVVSHNAFGYLANRYGFTTLPIAGISPTEEPSAQELAEITKTVESTGINFIFTEVLVSDKLAKTIADETGVQVLQLQPLEGLTEEELNAGEDYISLMNDNLVNLEKALNCQ